VRRNRPRAARTTGAGIHYPPGEQPSAWIPGDFLVIHSESWQSRLIQWAQRGAARGDDRRFAYWDHTAIVVSPCGELVESVSSRGAIRSPAANYRGSDYYLVRIDACEEARRRAVEYAEWAADHALPYGWWCIAGIACATISGGRLTLQAPGQAMCSGLVARALERSGALFHLAPSHVTPADLACFYGVEPPPGGSPARRRGDAGGAGPVGTAAPAHAWRR
jgi:hypothetical protein